jgi:hypothetical protein
MCRILLTTVIIASPGLARAGEDGPGIRPITGADTVIALIHFASNGSPVREKPTGLVLAVWPDGKAVWSEDSIRGGPPFREGRVDPKRVKALLSKFDRDGYFDEKTLANRGIPLHSAHHALLIADGKRKLVIVTHHEFMDEILDRPGMGRDGSRLADLRQQAVREDASRLWLLFRIVWGETRYLLADILPRESQPATGSQVIEDWKKFSWREGFEQVAAPRRGR